MSDKQLNSRQKAILGFLSWGADYALRDLLKIFDTEEVPSPATLRRDLSSLCDLDFLVLKGSKKSAVYRLTINGLLCNPIDPKQYCGTDLDLRSGSKSFNFDVFKNIQTGFFSSKELVVLNDATKKFNLSSEGASDTLRKKELERFIIELSWKSSKIEGNTYSLLDTERLLREGIEAEGHSKEEALMIINHKVAFQHILDSLNAFSKPTITDISNIHYLLTDKLNITIGLRNRIVGITGSIYRPLEMRSQIEEAILELLSAMNRINDPFSKALLMLLGIAYIQPFEDGNKRTSRLSANSVLLAHNCAPLSYRSVDEISYKEAVLVFYEKNSLIPIKEIFIDQYLFACNNYLVQK
jgi:hypothetical protein